MIVLKSVCTLNVADDLIHANAVVSCTVYFISLLRLVLGDLLAYLRYIYSLLYLGYLSLICVNVISAKFGMINYCVGGFIISFYRVWNYLLLE